MSFTRARSKLIIVGSRKTLRTAPVLAEFFELMDTKGWILSLPPGANTLHSRESVDVKAMPSKKRTVDDIRLENKENGSSGVGKVKKVKVNHGVLRGRSLLQDVVNDVS